MSESMNLDSNDIVGSLEGFESLEHIQAELGILDETSQGNQGDHVEVLELMRHPIVDKRRDGNVKNEIIMEDDMGDDDEMIASRLEESMSTHMMHSNVSDIMHNVMDMDEHEVENERMDQGSHDGHADDLDQRRLFSEGVIKNEIIVDSQVMTEGLGDDDNSIEAASIHNEQVSSKMMPLQLPELSHQFSPYFPDSRLNKFVWVVRRFFTDRGIRPLKTSSWYCLNFQL